MGCDGGTIPKRCELVREKKKKEKIDRNMNRFAKWNTCSLSNTILKIPVVGCRKGKLYNKDVVIEHIINRSNIESNINHIRKLKDVKDLNLKQNPSYKVSNLSQIELQSASQFICPLSGLEMNGKHEFIFIWNCGCVMSKRAYKEMNSNNCLVCGIKFNDDDVIVINSEIDEQPVVNEIDTPVISVKKSKKQKIVKKKNELNEMNNCQNSNKSSIYKSLFVSSDKNKTVDSNKIYWISTFNYSI